MNNSSSSSSGGVGFYTILAILFIALKLTNYIDWSWWWVLAPLWIPLSFLALIGGIVAVCVIFLNRK